MLAAPTDSQRVLVGPQPLAILPLSPPPNLLLNLPATHRLLPPLHPPQLTMSAQVLVTKDHPHHNQLYTLLGFVTKEDQNIKRTNTHVMSCLALLQIRSSSSIRYALLGWAHAAVLFLGGQAALSNLTLRHGMVGNYSGNKQRSILS